MGNLEDTNASADCVDQSLDDLIPFVYAELRRLAAGYLHHASEPITLQPTALVHEAYLRLARQGDRVKWRNRGHFFGIAARCMRQILVEQARSRLAQKRGGGVRLAAFDECSISGPEADSRMVALDDALGVLSAVDPRKGEAIELHYFAGLSPEEMCEAMGVSASTARRDLRIAEAWLHREMTHREMTHREKLGKNRPQAGEADETVCPTSENKAPVSVAREEKPHSGKEGPSE